MNALLATISLGLAVVIALSVPGGAAAVVFAVVVAFAAALAIRRTNVEDDKLLLLQLFIAALLVRVFIGTVIYSMKLQNFFGGDALTYDELGMGLLAVWQGDVSQRSVVNDWATGGGGWGMLYVVAGVYSIIGRNPLAIQFFNAVMGAATAPVIYLCARHIFSNVRVARASAFFVAFYPSLVLWSAQGLKDAIIVFLLAAVMLTTLKLDEKFSTGKLMLLVCALFGLLTLRFYIFYMTVVAVGGSFIIGTRRLSPQNLVRVFILVAGLGLVMTYLGVLRSASAQFEAYSTLEAVNRSRADLARNANTGFAGDVDVSTTAGAIGMIPVGMVYLLFAPFPWQLANLRQSITLPEMIVWWASFPLLVIGLYFTMRYRLRQALPILLFTMMLTLAYSIFQGNVGTAYRQRSQLLVFYFIFVSVGFVLMRERREDRAREAERAKQASRRPSPQAVAAHARYETWKQGSGKELEEVARGLSERIDF
ncbi:MAG TPA: glycosyltransferase family 39 protein [Pyrinomonadaceae bacterium]|nr:glycosyltransferase family 39 protein [Pyrinomonadaceae bacterium]